VTATVNGSSKTVTVNFVADSSTAQIGAGDLTVMADNALANGIVGNNVQVKVTDSQGNAIAGQDVSFSASNGATIAAQGRTDSNGELLMTVTSKTAGVSTITARVNGSSQQVDVTFVADGGTAQINAGNLTVVTDNAVADGKATNQIQLKVTDANGNAVAGQTVTFSASNGAMIDGSAQTTTAGTLTLDVTSLVSGVSTVTASINGSSQHVDVIFIADNSTAQLIGSNMNIITNHAVADGAMVNAVRILVTDQQGNPVASQLITLSASNGATVAETVATNMAGVATAVLTSTTAGTSTLTATVNGSNQSVDVNFVADANTARIADGDMTVVTDNLLANGTDENQVQVKITDANGNIVAGAKVDFSASHNAVAATSAFSDDNGLVLVPITSTLAGVSTVTATINGSRHSVDVSFNADASTAQIVVGSLIVIINNSLANGSSLNTVQAKVTDAYGNPLVNQSVNFIADNGAKMGRPGLTDENGMIQVGLSSSVAGPSTITAVLNGSTETVVVTFIADTSTAGIAAGDMIVVKDNAFANGSDANNVKMTVKDAKGNVLADQPVTLSADNGATVASSASTDSNGEITVPVTNTLVGSSTLTATTNGSSQSVTVNFVVDRSTAQIAVSDMVVTQNNAVANKSAQNVVQVRVSDSWNNPVPDAVVTFSANNGATVVPEASTDANGLMAVMITSNKAGISTLTAGINSSSRSVDVNFIAATIPVITQVEDVTGSVKGNLTSGQPTDETKPVLQGTAEKNGTVRLYEGSTQIGTATADDTGLWNITVNKALSGDGDHSLTATSALTSQLPESDPSEAFILHLDTVAEVPVITRVQDSSGNLVNGQDAPGGEVDFWGTAEPGATVIIYGVRMKDRIRMAIDSVIADTGGNWHAVMSDERVFQMTSEYQFVPVSTDIAGNSTTMSQATAFSLQYHSWPAPVGTPTYVLAGGDMTEEEMTAQLAATGSLLINIQAGERSARIFLPQSDASNPGQHVYVSNDTSAVAGIYPDAGGNSTILPAGSQTTWYSNGSTWKQMN
ncbi:Ig-like domain-containing protein, partial [Scandinavium sp. NPDC088450]|uniref:Ig-like domain-containing protein n=1 Tax=Scandinavium sp. NPDC088450 TaxID=3364514 RepID=UPI00384D1E47